MTKPTITLALLATFVIGARAQETAPTADPFPPSNPVAEGVSPAALGELDGLVQRLVDGEEIVGAELMVIKNGRTILHEAYGWSDVEAETPMETGSVFCVRSMTKPVAGAAVLMLIEDDLLELDDPVAKYLPSFDVEGSREITVEHLLTHTGGLPMSLLMGKDLRELDGIRGVADLWAGHEPEFEPGSAFNYSDQGTDTLTVLVEIASGKPAAEFVRERVLDPLDMRDTTCVMTEDHPLRARAISKYAGMAGEWKRFWSPEDPPIFPFFLGSQGLYSTLPDYARFMEFWQRGGRVGRERVLGSRYVRKVLTPGPYTLGGPTSLPDLRTDYGYLMQLWTGPAEEEGEREVVAFGHTGSDGTHAWVFPEQKAMVLYFTQSRGTSSGLQVEEVLGELFFGVPFDPIQAAPPLDQYLGYYWEGEGDMYRAIVLDGDGLALEIMRQGVVPLTYIGDDRWKLRPIPSKVIEFDRDEGGLVTGYHIDDHQEFRFDPSPELPTVEDLAARVAAKHRLDLLETLGPMRTHSTLSIASMEIFGDVTSLYAWPDRFRLDTAAGENFEHLAYDGESVQYYSSNEEAAVMDGMRAEFLRRDNAFARFGDWGRWHPQMEVIQRLEKESESPDSEPEVVYLVRAGDTSAPGRTLYVHTTGVVFREDSLTYIEGLGRIGQRIDFGDFEEVSGMLLPQSIHVTLANPLIGKITLEVQDTELGVDLPEGTFALME